MDAADADVMGNFTYIANTIPIPEVQLTLKQCQCALQMDQDASSDPGDPILVKSRTLARLLGLLGLLCDETRQRIEHSDFAGGGADLTKYHMCHWVIADLFQRHGQLTSFVDALFSVVLAECTQRGAFRATAGAPRTAPAQPPTPSGPG